MSQWAIDNASRDYPFADGYAYAPGLDQIVDAYVVTGKGVHAALSRFIISGVISDIAVVDAENPAVVLASTANAAAVRTEYGDYVMYQIVDPVTSGVVRLTVYKKTSIVNFVGLAPFAAAAHDYATDALTAINGVNGNVVLELDDEADAALQADGSLLITALSPEDRLGALPGCQPVMTINAVPPANSGAFAMRSGADNNHRLSAEGYAIRIENLGQPCCTCTEYYNAFNRIAAYDKELAEAINSRVAAVTSKYAELVKRFGVYVTNRPVVNIQQLTNTPLVAAGLWGSPVSRAVYAIMRMTLGSYSAGLGMALTNSTWYPVTLRVVVSSSVVGAAKSGAVRFSMVTGGHRDFDGFPGEVTVTLPPGGTCQITSENHDVSMAGVEAVYTAAVTITPVLANIEPPQGLTNPASGGTISLTTRGVVPRSATMTRTPAAGSP